MPIVDLTNVDAEEQERVYIKQEGKITLKVVKVTEGKSASGYDEIKVHFQDKAGRWAIDNFILTPNALWKLKVLTKALKLPNIVDTNLFINRYVIANFKAKDTQNGGTIYEIKKYEPSKLTNTYEPPKPQVVYENTQGEQYQPNTPTQAEMDISDDEIPF